RLLLSQVNAYWQLLSKKEWKAAKSYEEPDPMGREDEAPEKRPRMKLHRWRICSVTFQDDLAVVGMQLTGTLWTKGIPLHGTDGESDVWKLVAGRWLLAIAHDEFDRKWDDYQAVVVPLPESDCKKKDED